MSDTYIRKIKINGKEYTQRSILSVGGHTEAHKLYKKEENVLLIEEWGMSGNGWWNVYRLEEKDAEKCKEDCVTLHNVNCPNHPENPDLSHNT